ncbi:hypothetical protein [Planomonospora sp. ID82291]|nr:hypothetical protein [Planomonospora sp. ID82291]
MKFAYLVALVWSATTTESTPLAVLCWALAGSAVLGFLIEAAD